MMRTWTVRGCAALLALIVAGSALRAAPPSETPPNDDKLTQVLDKLGDVTTRLGILQANQLLQIKSMQDDIERLKSDLRRLDDEVRRLSTTPPSIAASINPSAPASPLTTGMILLENRYNAPATVVVNGTSIRLEPFERKNVNAPLGRFTYAVYTDNYGLIQAQIDRYLVPGRDFPITINP